MTAREKWRQQIREGLNALGARLGAIEKVPKFDLNSLNIYERRVFDAFCENSTSEDRRNFSKLSYEKKIQLRALPREFFGEFELVTLSKPNDRRDVAILTEIDARTSPLQRSVFRE